MAGSGAKTTVVIGNLKRDIDEEALAGLCSQLGRVVNFRLHILGPTADSLASAVVDYATADEADHAVASVRGRLIAGQPVTATVAVAGTKPGQSASGRPSAAPSASSSAMTSPTGFTRSSYPGAPKRMTMKSTTDDNSTSASALPGYQANQATMDDDIPPRHATRNTGVPHNWESGRDPIPAERAPTSSARYDEAYSHHVSWRGGVGGGGAPPPRRADMNERIPVGSRYIGERHHGLYAGAANGAVKPWHSSRNGGNSRERDSEWAPDGGPPSPSYPNPTQRVPREERAAAAYPGPSSAWPDKVDMRGRTPAYGRGAGDGGGGDYPLPARRSPRAPAGPSLSYDIHTKDERFANDELQDLVETKRTRPPYAHGGISASSRPAWTEHGGYSAPPVASKDEFDKEVMRQAALLVAERELRARVDVQQQQPVVKQDHDWKKDQPHRADDRRPDNHGSREKERRITGSTTSNENRKSRRARSVEGGDRLSSKRNRDSSRDRHVRGRTRSRDRGNDRVGEKWRGDSSSDRKKARRDGSPQSRSGNIKASDRNGVSGKHVDINSSSRSRPSHRDEDRLRPSRDDHRPKQREREHEIRQDNRLGARSREDDRLRQKGIQHDSRALHGPSRDDSRGSNRKREDDRMWPRGVAVDAKKDDKVMLPLENDERGGGRKHEDNNSRRERDSRAAPSGGMSYNRHDQNIKERDFAANISPRAYKPPPREVGNTLDLHQNSYHHNNAEADNERRFSAQRPGGGGAGYNRDHNFVREPPGGFSGGGGPNRWESSTADSGWYVHVGGISFSTTFTDLAKRFAAFGDVNGFKVIFNNVTCRTQREDKANKSKDGCEAPAVVLASTGFAFISFDNEEGMIKAIEGMNNQLLDGHLLKVNRGRIGAKGMGNNMSSSFGHRVHAHPELPPSTNFPLASNSLDPANLKPVQRHWPGVSIAAAAAPAGRVKHDPNVSHERTSPWAAAMTVKVKHEPKDPREASSAATSLSSPSKHHSDNNRVKNDRHVSAVRPAPMAGASVMGAASRNASSPTTSHTGVNGGRGSSENGRGTAGRRNSNGDTALNIREKPSASGKHKTNE